MAREVPATDNDNAPGQQPEKRAIGQAMQRMHFPTIIVLLPSSIVMYKVHCREINRGGLCLAVSKNNRCLDMNRKPQPFL
eukprot:scaffold803_cov367-Pavlova_lutheri.AAC.5